ncbi:MAG: histidinol-phosphatase HisJ family protein [bacterium]
MFTFPLADKHVHPDCSTDANGSVREFCEKAFELGLHEIMFTTHYEITPAGRERYGYIVLDGKREPANLDSVKRYIELVRAVGREFTAQGLLVRCGLEVGWDETIADQLARELPQLDLEFIIGSVHETDDIHIASSEAGPGYYQTHKIEDWLPRYFQMAEQIAESGLFDVLGHLDVYKRHGLPVYGDVIKTAHRPYLGSLLTKMARYELGLEINTSGMRHGLGEYYPSMEIVNEARRAGVRIESLGSDAHAPEQLALDFEAASQIAYELLPAPLEDGYEY